MKPVDFRNFINEQINLFPELFPPEIANGFQMKDIYHSKKLVALSIGDLLKTRHFEFF